MPWASPKHLHLDVPRAVEVRARGRPWRHRRPTPLRGARRVRPRPARSSAATTAHALAAAARGSLDQQRESDVGGSGGPDRRRRPRRRLPTGAAAPRRPRPRAFASTLEPMSRIWRRRRADPDEAGGRARPRRSRRSRRGSRSPGGPRRRPRSWPRRRPGRRRGRCRLTVLPCSGTARSAVAHVLRPGIRGRVDRDGRDAHRVRRTEDPAGDLATVRDEQPGDRDAERRGHGGAHIRKTP